MINDIRETRTDGAAGSMWNWSWGLLFVCLMTMLSMATQRYSGYVEPHSTEAHTVAPVVASAR